MEGEETVPVIDRVIELQPARLLDVDGYTYIDKDKSVRVFEPPVPQPIAVSTLSGFAQLIDADFEDYEPSAVLVHVEAFNRVSLQSTVSDKWGRRQIFVKAEAPKPEREFRFNTYYAQEEFNIALASMFEQGAELRDLVKLAGNLAAKMELRQEDDGISQKMTVKAGVHLVEEAVAKPRVILRPFRTFLEIDQPAGEFIFRVKIGDAGNACALFEADAGRWKLEAMDSIASWLVTRLGGSGVDGVGSIPVIH